MATNIDAGVDEINQLCDMMSMKGEKFEGLMVEEEVLAEKEESSQWCLVGRFLMNQTINFDYMQNTLAAL